MTLVDRVPQGVGFVSVQSGFPICNESNGVVSCLLGNLAAGEIVSAGILAEVPASMSGTVLNSASVVANETDPNLINNSSESSSSINREADLAVDNKYAPGLATRVNQLAYTITVTNNGPSDSTGVVVTDRLAEAASLVTFGGSTTECTMTNMEVTCKLDNLARGDTKTITLVTAIATEGMVANTATVKANEADGFIFNNTSTATVQARLASEEIPPPQPPNVPQAPSVPVPTESPLLPDSNSWLLILIGSGVGLGLVMMLLYYNGWHPFGARKRNRQDIIP